MKDYYRKASEYLRGIYGMDTLSAILLALGAILCLLSRLVPSGRVRWLVLPALVLVILCGFRFFSRRIDRRRRENDLFCRMAAPVFEKLGPPDEETKAIRAEKREKRLLEKEEKLLKKEQEREFRFFNCPMCKQRLRVPRGNGKVEITCPNCGNRFIRKT